MNRALLALTLLAACGGKPASSTTTPPAGGTDVAPPDGMAFKDMNADQRVAFMKLRVVPAMKPIFQAFDGKQFAAFDCTTCHGKGAENGEFDMPNPEIKVLPKPENFPEYMKDPKVNQWVMFMGGKVEPAMAKLLMLTPFDPKTGTGDFSCHGCHTSDGDDPKAHHDHDHHDHH